MAARENPALSDGAVLDPPPIEARGVEVAFGDQPALKVTHLSITAGHRLAVVGPNGAGKTTLVRVLAGLVQPTRGQVLIGGHRHSPSARRAIGLDGHQSYLYPELTVRENLELYGHLYGVRDVRGRVSQVLDQLELWDRQSDRILVLSRGTVQRVNLARAVLHDPPILLLDEPDTGLDAHGLRALERMLDGHTSENPDIRTRGRTVVLTTHQLEHALRFCRAVAMVHRGCLVGEAPTSDLDLSELRERYASLATRVGARGQATAGRVG